jgi:proline dehydrogenase
MRQRFPRYAFVRHAVRKFMPGETFPDALQAATKFADQNISAVFTHLGENITSADEAEAVTTHYLDLLEKVHESRLPAAISLKLTQLGFDLSEKDTFERFSRISARAEAFGIPVWIDMEDSAYTDRTLKFYELIKSTFNNTGLCLQAYLHRTAGDLESLLKISPNLRIVKGAYREPAVIAFPGRAQVDANYRKLAEILLPAVKTSGAHAVFATHDETLLEQIISVSLQSGIPAEKIEFNMLYGIKPSLQVKMARRGFKVGVLISYGSAWFPWYMRRLAERPANLWFVIRNIFRR